MTLEELAEAARSEPAALISASCDHRATSSSDPCAFAAEMAAP